MIRLKELAEMRKTSYEAVRKQFVKYEKDLKGHFEKKGKLILLDEHAVKFLNEKRENNAPVIYQINQTEQLEALKIALSEANGKIDLLEKQITEQTLLIEEKGRLQGQLEAVEQQLAESRTELERIRNRGLFARIFNKG